MRTRMKHAIRPGLLALAALATLAALGGTAACASDNGGSSGDAGSQGPAVRPISEIVPGEIEIVDLTATSAAVSVETTVDVVCAVVYGPGTGYGSIATDLDMAGGGHRVHRAPLRGLQPDTEYHYRLQGSGPDGTLYVSDDLTFRTPSANGADDANADLGANLASMAAGAQVVEVSSVFGGGDTWAPEHAIDGDLATEWSSNGDGDDAFITIELAEDAALSAVGLRTRTMTSSAQIRRFRVVVDGDEVLGPFDVPDAATMHTFEVDTRGRRLRFEVVESSGGNTGVVELAAFAGDVND